MSKRALIYARGRGGGFDKLDELLADVNSGTVEADVVIVSSGWVLGDDGETRDWNRQRIAAAGLELKIVDEEEGKKHMGKRIKWDPDLPRDISSIEAAMDEFLRTPGAIEPAKKATHHADGSKTVDMSPGMAHLLKLQQQLFRAVFKREPGPKDPVFWDRDREQHGCFPMKPISEDQRFKEATSAGVRGPQAYAMAKTGLIIASDNHHLFTEEQLDEWDAAVEEYEELFEGKEDIAALMKPPKPTPLRSWDETALIASKRFWDLSFGQGGGEHEMFDAIVKELTAGGVMPDKIAITEDSDGTLVPGENYNYFEGIVYDLLSQGLWANAGYPTLMASHTFTAALACTTVSKENAEDIEIPWTTFMVHLPSDMFFHPKTGDMIDRMLVSHHTAPKRFATMSVYARESGKRLGIRSPAGGSLADLLFIEEEKLDELVDPTSARLWRVMTRVCVGLLYTMQHTNNWKSKHPVIDSTRSWEKGPPKHRVVIVGRPLSYDARPDVREYLRGDRGGKGPPSVQTLVTGHYKRQTIGIGRLGRKVIWIEPYWRGPKDAPILMRPKKVGPGNGDNK